MDSSADLGVAGRGECFPQLLLGSDGEDAPFARHALERMRTALLEREPRPDHEVAQRAGHQHLVRPGQGAHTRPDVHTGECEVRGDDIGGIGVHIGARVSALAGPNDVLMSSTLRDLVIGSGLEFEERGAHELKGVPGEWRLFAVASA